MFVPDLNAPTFMFNRYGTDHTVRHESPGVWKFSRYSNGRKKRPNAYYTSGCRSIRDAVLDYFFGIDDDEAARIVASTEVERT